MAVFSSVKIQGGISLGGECVVNFAGGVEDDSLVLCLESEGMSFGATMSRGGYNLLS